MGRKAITEEQFNSIKLLKAAKVSNSNISKALNLSAWTIGEATKCANIEQYRENTKKRYDARKLKENEKAIDLVFYDNPTTTITLPDGYVSQLITIENKLDDITKRLIAVQEKVDFLESHTPVSTRKWSIR
jgi:hypothetical protein